MASIHKDRRRHIWQIAFRWDGEQYKRSTQSRSKKDAETLAGRVNETIKMLRTGHLAMPEDVEPGAWILSHGQLAQQRSTGGRETALRLGEICNRYFEDQKHKSENTLMAERIHIRHFKRLLGESVSMGRIDVSQMQRYVNLRSQVTFRNRPISGATIHKELVTFRLIWKWAQVRRLVRGQCPIVDEFGQRIVSIPKPAEKEKFLTWEQITRRIKRESLSDDDAALLWGSLFLDEEQVGELLEHVRVHGTRPYVYPMFAFAAYTGARRSEILRSHVDDFDLEQRQVRIREKKRRKDLSFSTRFVPLNHHLVSIMERWFDEYPSGKYTIVDEDRMGTLDMGELNEYAAHSAFKNALKKSKWSVIRGFHVLRHSFGANLARSGRISSEVIGRWMGHSTENMRVLYQHLFPQDGPALVDLLRYGGGGV